MAKQVPERSKSDDSKASRRTAAAATTDNPRRQRLWRDLGLIAIIGIILLIGIVKKNAILMIDFALQVERAEGLSPQEAILRASLVRLRPIMMTTLAAILGAVPLVIGSGYGSEFRQPLGVAIIGGLMLSQVLTLYSTPAIYVLMDRFGTLHRRTPP